MQSRVIWALLAATLTACSAFRAEHSPAPTARPEAAGAEILSNARQLTFEGLRSGEGYFSASGQQLVFQSEREPGNPFYQIYWMDLATGDVHRVSPGHGKTTCAWIHPSGDRVLFASTHEDPAARDEQARELAFRASGETRRYAWDFDEHFDLFASGVRGEAPTALASAPGYDAEASWSPDGKLVVFASNRHAYGATLSQEERASLARDPSAFVDLYRINADGSDLRRLTRSPGYDGGPFFSADGTRIVWRRFSPDGATAEIWVMNADGSGARPITDLGAMSWAPYFHPSGDYVVFTTNRHGFGNFELYLVDAQGASDPVRVTGSDGFDGLPVFSPDGSRLAWTRRPSPDATSQIHLADWDDAFARRALGLPPQRPALRARPAPRRAISPEALRARVHALSSDEFSGRLTGTQGERRATEYVARAFEEAGLVPAGDSESFYQLFEFTAGISLGADNALWLEDAAGPAAELQLDSDWRPLAFSATGEVQPSEIVFAGYGIVAPAGDGFEAVDAYADLDVRDRWVLVLRFLPEGASAERRQHLNAYAALRHKAMLARDKGARGLIVAPGPNARVRRELVRLARSGPHASGSIAVVSVSSAAAGRLVEAAGQDLGEIQDRLDAGEALPGFAIPHARLAARIDLVQERRTGRNVLARLGEGPSDRPAVVVGAHVDHLGHGEGGTSLAREGDKGAIHRGADDNASGVAALIEVARELAASRRRGELALEREILFAAWSGEELGLLGSTHFIDALRERHGDPASLAPWIAAYLNMDMVGRLDDQLMLYGMGSSSIWPSAVEAAAAPLRLPIAGQQDSYLPTDSTAFYLAGVPVLSAFTGPHEDYHTPRDDPDRLNYAGAAEIATLVERLTLQLASQKQEPDYIASDRPSRAAPRAGLRVYLGTIPDYSGKARTGVGLSGVVKNGPAERAGLRSGDVVLAIAGTKIENIYDYTYALDALKVGEPVAVRVLRDGHALTLSVTPDSRD